jgi:hypothetical protein
MTVLKFTSIPRDGMGQHHRNHASHYYFVRLGEQWPNDPRFRLIAETTSDRKQAKEFETEEAAREVWCACNKPANWEVVTE